MGNIRQVQLITALTGEKRSKKKTVITAQYFEVFWFHLQLNILIVVNKLRHGK
jgi:hypothetical protein